MFHLNLFSIDNINNFFGPSQTSLMLFKNAIFQRNSVYIENLKSQQTSIQEITLEAILCKHGVKRKQEGGRIDWCLCGCLDYASSAHPWNLGETLVCGTLCEQEKECVLIC